MRVNHVNIVVTNMERSLAFYVGLLKMRVTFEAGIDRGMDRGSGGSAGCLGPLRFLPALRGRNSL